MGGAKEVRIPRFSANDDVVTIAEWTAENGQKVGPGDAIATLETSKAVVELEAADEGFLDISQPEGAEVHVGAAVALIWPDASAVGSRTGGSDGNSQDNETGVVAKPTADERSVRLSRKAEELVKRFGIDPTVFGGMDLVREEDVRRHIAEEGADVGEYSKSSRYQSARAEVAVSSTGHTVSLWGDARESARGRNRSMQWLIVNYVWRIWLLGNLSRVVPRGMNLIVHRMRGVKIGAGCFVDPAAIVETAFPENITIGDDVRIAAGAVLMTHIKPPHYLRNNGFMNTVVKPVKLRDHSFVGVNAVIMPGVTVGRAAVVASGAVVTEDVPDYTMVAGNPAKIVRRFRTP